MARTGTLQISYTLEFHNGRILRHQGPLEVAQYRSDGRVASIRPEPLVLNADCVAGGQ